MRAAFTKKLQSLYEDLLKACMQWKIYLNRYAYDFYVNNIRVISFLNELELIWHLL